MDAHGKTSLVFFDKKVLVNSDTYIQKVLGLFVRKDVPHRFPRYIIEKQHGVLPRQRIFPYVNVDAAVTRRRRYKYVSPEEWRPMSPEAAPMDYIFRGA